MRGQQLARRRARCMHAANTLLGVRKYRFTALNRNVADVVRIVAVILWHTRMSAAWDRTEDIIERGEEEEPQKDEEGDKLFGSWE